MRRGVNERRRFENKRTNLFFPIVRTKHCARDIRIWIKKSQRDRDKKMLAMPAGETTWTDKEGGRE
jgi:hypothetical protein